MSKYLNLGLYSDIQKADIDAYLAEAYEAIDQAGSIDEVNAIVADSKELLDLVPTVWDEAKTFVATYVEDLSVYSEVDQRYIEILIERSLNNIEQAETKAEVEEIVATFKSWIDALSPIDYEAMRSAAKSALDTYVKPNKYTEENRQAVLEIIEKPKPKSIPQQPKRQSTKSWQTPKRQLMLFRKSCRFKLSVWRSVFIYLNRSGGSCPNRAAQKTILILRPRFLKLI